MAEACVDAFLLEGKDPSAVALRFLRGNRSYGDLALAVTRVANYLLSLGCRKGDRVLLVGENSFFWVASYIGAMRAGLVCVPQPTDVSPEELCELSDLTGAVVVFVDAKLWKSHRSTLRDRHVVIDPDDGGRFECRSRTAFSSLEGDGATESVERPSISSDDLAALMFTSGSTGRPRGVMISHGNIIANTESIIGVLDLTGRDSVMDVLPFHYCFGASLLHTHLRVGGSVAVEPRFMYPDVVLDRMRELECTGFAGVPSHFQILLRRSSLKKKRFPHLRYVQQAGGRLAPHFITELRNALPDTQVFVMYGLTEATARLSSLPPERVADKPGSIGIAIPGVELRVLNEQGVEVRAGEVGEIVAEGDNIANGYWHAPRESAETFRNGRLHTGDLATVDEDGFMYIVDRASDFLKIRGERIGCRKLEEQLLGFDGLLEAAVIGVPDDILGEAVKAFVVPRAPSTDFVERLRIYCRDHLPTHLHPRDTVVLDALPKNAAGKVMKAVLREHR